MDYAIIFALLALLAYREWAHDRERRALLDRIQAPVAAQAAASEALLGSPGSFQVSDEELVRRKAVERGLSPDDFRIPPGWT